MGSRLELQNLLEDILESENVYFQPPESTKIRYPAIVYSRSRIDSKHADDGAYTSSVQYTVTLIDPNPDSEFVFKIAQLPYCRHDRNYKSDNLNHDVFTLYF